MPQNPVTFELPPDERETAPPTPASIEEPAYVPVRGKEPTTDGDRLRQFLHQNRLDNPPPPPPGPPAAMTERQRNQIELEMEAGRRSVAKHAAQQANRPQPKPDKSEGTTTPVFRPEDYVPNLNSKTDSQRGVRQL